MKGVATLDEALAEMFNNDDSSPIRDPRLADGEFIRSLAQSPAVHAHDPLVAALEQVVGQRMDRIANALETLVDCFKGDK